MTNVRYSSNYLSQVIYRINFISSSLINDETLKGLKDELGKEYGALSSVVQQGLIVQNDQSGISAEKDINTVWRIESSDRTHTIEIERDSLALIFEKYDHFEPFQEIVNKVQKLFLQTFFNNEEVNVQRLGLRYINQIKLPRESLIENYINNSLTSHLEFTDRKNIRRSMHSMAISHDDETMINFNFGVFNKYFPAPIVDNEFILDLDAYSTFSISPENIPRLLEKFNGALTAYFEISISDQLRKDMEVIK